MKWWGDDERESGDFDSAQSPPHRLTPHPSPPHYLTASPPHPSPLTPHRPIASPLTPHPPSGSLNKTLQLPILSMQQNLRMELAEMVEPAEWSWLSPHATRDALVVVNNQLDLVDVGYAIATDDVARVDRWIAEELLAKPTARQMASWLEADQTRQKRFRALIVQPYVLVQDSLTP